MAASAQDGTPQTEMQMPDTSKGTEMTSEEPGPTRAWSAHFDLKHAVLEAIDLRFCIDTKDGERVLVNNVSFTLTSGDALAMMGPSGAGKTTLLDLMTLKISGSRSFLERLTSKCTAGKRASGSVKLNGETLTMDQFHAQAAFCEQYDSHWAFLTCKEVMLYAAALCIVDPVDRAKTIKEIMSHLGLDECANTKAGNAFLKGMSGGQRKRLSMGVALLKGPNVLFLDEPTSGLDAASTKACMEYLTSFAKEARMIVVATIHQPSTDVFMGFSKVLFLANGRTAYVGAPQEVGEYTARIGHPLPDATNPADFFIELINSEFVGREQVDSIVAKWRANAPAVTALSSYEKLSLPSRPSTLAQFVTLLRRHGKLALRDPTLYVGRMFVFLLANTFFALVYVKARDREQQYAAARFYLVSWFGASVSMFSVVVVYAANEEFSLAKKDLHNGILSVKAFVLAKLTLQLPNMFLLAICALVVPAYAIANFNWAGFVTNIIQMTVMIWCFECMGESLGVGIRNPLIGMLGMVLLWFCSFLFCGNFLNPDFIPWPFRIFCYTLPLRYWIRSTNYNELKGTLWGGAVEAPAHLSSGLGFACPALSPLECFGRTGEQVQISLGKQFGNLDGEDTNAVDFLACVLIALAFKAIACVLIAANTANAAPLQPGIYAPSKEDTRPASQEQSSASPEPPYVDQKSPSDEGPEEMHSQRVQVRV